MNDNLLYLYGGLLVGFSIISKYAYLVTTKTSKINPLYVRNFRELIKLIPAIGSWIDANTVGIIQDRILNKKITELENKCKLAFSAEDGKDLLNYIVQINTLFFALIRENQEEAFKKNSELLNYLKGYVAVPIAKSKKFMPHPDFRIIIISGASATGKDSLLDLLYTTSILHR